MIPKRIYLREAELEELSTGERMVSCDEPYSDLTVEFTNLSQVWHSAGEEPKCKELLIIYYEDIGGLPIDALIYHGPVDCPWKELVKITGIIYWAYAKDILPKEVRSEVFKL